jgi:hypothetical protein
VKTAVATLTAARQTAETDLMALETDWASETQEIRDALEKVLRAFQPDGIDGGEYLRLRDELGSLTPLIGKRTAKQSALERLVAERQGLLIAAEDRRAGRLRDLQREAKKVGRKLPGIVQASVRDEEDRTALTDLLDGRISGRLDRVRAALNDADLLSPRAFVQACRGGAEAIVEATRQLPRRRLHCWLAPLPRRSCWRRMSSSQSARTLQLNVGTQGVPNLAQP